MSDDLLDLFAGKHSKATKPKPQDPGYHAPIELMSQFLMLITQNKMREALALSKEILTYEPNNRIVLEYQSTLRDYIDQGLADTKNEEIDEDENVEESDNDEEDSDKENDSEEEEKTAAVEETKTSRK